MGQQYEDKINEILETLRGIATMEQSDASPPISFWIQRYKSDMPFMLKELANSRARTRELNEIVKVLQDRISRAINVLSGEKHSGGPGEAQDKVG